MARFCFQLAELYELRKSYAGALTNYERALEIWRYHGSRGEGQCKIIENRLNRLPEKNAVMDTVSHGVKNLAVDSKTGTKVEDEKSDVEEKKTTGEGKKKKKRKKPKK